MAGEVTSTTLAPTTTIPDLVAKSSAALPEVPEDLAAAFIDYLASRNAYDFATGLGDFLVQVALSEGVTLSAQSNDMDTATLLDEITAHEQQHGLRLTIDRIAETISKNTQGNMPVS